MANESAPRLAHPAGSHQLGNMGNAAGDTFTPSAQCRQRWQADQRGHDPHPLLRIGPGGVHVRDYPGGDFEPAHAHDPVTRTPRAIGYRDCARKPRPWCLADVLLAATVGIVAGWLLMAMAIKAGLPGVVGLAN